MFRVIVQLSCMIVLASVFYDVLSCNRFYKRMFLVRKLPPSEATHTFETRTYKSIKYVGSSRYGKMLLKKWKKARRICFKSLGWVSCNTPADNRATVNQVEPCVHFANWSLDLTKNVISLIHYMLVCFGEKMSSFKHPILSCNDLMTVAKVIIAGAYQQLQKCKQATMGFMTEIMPLR